jgi:three-Cys-motif partner protein
VNQAYILIEGGKGGKIVGQTKDFFKEKKAWSVLKDEIRDYYLVPYIAKVFRTGKPLVIVDCFAGKGKFDNGEKGSPLLIAEHIRDGLRKNTALGSKIRGIFIENKYSAELRNNLSGYPNISILVGAFEDNLQNILSLDKNSNIFLYVDPYGIKSLSLSNFNQIKNNCFSSLEMLMNFNSAGFLREGFRLLKNEELFKDDELADYETDEESEESKNTIERMNAIAGGTYWQDILNKKMQGTIDIYQAEDMFISEYSLKLKNIYKYTVNIPIKVKSNHLPKYRLIFGSNHEDGLILMADNMNKKWKQMIESQRGGQRVLFDFEFPDFTVSKGYDLYNDIMSSIPASGSGILLKKLIIDLIQKYGITFSDSDYRNKVRQMEKDAALLVDRVPATTKTGKQAISMDYGEYKITIRKRI